MAKIDSSRKTTLEKYLEVCTLVLNTTDVPDSPIEEDLSNSGVLGDFPDLSMPGPDLPLVDACPFYGENNA